MRQAAAGIAVWAAAVDAVPEALWPRLERLLDAAERQRAGRFRCPARTREFQAAHALKRLMLTAMAGGAVRPQAWAFETGARGKPRLAGGAGQHFNLSHCEGLVACAVSRHVELGLDVECLDQPAPLDLAASSFAASENAWLRGLPAAERPGGFFRLWTLKEACLKAAGLGLAQPLGSFALAFDPLRLSVANASLGEPAAWRFEQHPVGARHILALAWSGGPAAMPVEVETIRLQALEI